MKPFLQPIYMSFQHQDFLSLRSAKPVKCHDHYFVSSQRRKFAGAGQNVPMPKRTQPKRTQFWSKRTHFFGQKRTQSPKTYPIHYFITLTYNISSTLDKQLHKKSWYPLDFFLLSLLFAFLFN